MAKRGYQPAFGFLANAHLSQMCTVEMQCGAPTLPAARRADPHSGELPLSL
jgi:hypothetical protein